MIDLLRNTFPKETPSSVSVKPTSICAFEGDSPQTIVEGMILEGRLEALVKHAKDNGICVTLDMEDSKWTYVSIQVGKQMWMKGYDNFGICLQSRLDRTQADIREIFSKTYPVPKEKMRVRACIGIYEEPEGAENDKEIAKERLLRRVDDLFGYGVYVEIATHDPRFVRRIIREVIVPRGIHRDRFEFQFLKGVHNGEVLAQKLSAEGYKVRFYMPTELREGDGTPYMQRRLLANPTLLTLGAKNVIQRVLFGANGNSN